MVNILLQKAGRLERLTKTDWNYQNRAISELGARHTMLLSHIRAVLTLSCRAHHPGIELVAWREGRGLIDSTEVAFDRGYARVPVAPDAFFTLSDAKGRAHFLVEADRGTMPVKRFILKLKAYAAWFEEKKHQEKLGIRFFRVLTVTSSAARAAHFVAASRATQNLPALGRMFLFTNEQALSLACPESMFGSIWTSVASDEPCSIVASAVQKQTKGGPTTMAQNPQTATEGRGEPRV